MDGCQPRLVGWDGMRRGLVPRDTKRNEISTIGTGKHFDISRDVAVFHDGIRDQGSSNDIAILLRL